MPRSAALSSLSVAQIQRFLEVRRAQLKDLNRQKKSLVKQMAKIDAQIARIGGNGGKGGLVSMGVRPKNKMSLVEAISTVMGKSASPMPVGKIEEGVRALGYKSSAANFRSLINQTLIKDKRFSAVSRGVYQMKK